MGHLSDLSDAVPGSTRLPSVRSMLALIVVACLLPATIGIGALVCYLDRDGHAQRYKETLQSTRALPLLIDDELDLAKTAAEMLATASDLRRANWNGLHARAKALLETRNGGRNAIFSDVNGQQIANTSVPFGVPLPMSGDLEHLRHSVASGEPAISGLFRSALTGRNMVSVSVPAFVDGKVAYIISVGIPAQQLNQILERTQLPAQWVASTVDTSGTILLHTHDPTQFIGKKTTAAFMQHMRAQAPGAMFDMTTVDGTPSLALYSRSVWSNWGVVIAIPHASLTAQLMRSLAFFGLGISLLFGAGTALAWFMGSKISRSIELLKAGADAMGTQLMGTPATGTQPMPAVSTVHFREANDLAQAMMRSASALAQRTQALQASLVALKTSEESYRILIEGPPDAILLHQDGKVLSVNPAFVMFAGDRSAQQWVGKSILDSIDPVFHQAVLERMTQLDNVDASATLPIGQITCLKLDGTPFRVEIQSVSVDYQGRRAVHTTLRDISERQRADAERMAEALFHRQLLEQLPIGVALRMLARGDSATTLAPGQYVLLCVTDTGCGMSLDVMTSAMLPFFTTKERGRGTGLGIPMAHGFVKQCGGQLQLFSEPGHGTTVTLSLPLSDAVVVATAATAAAATTTAAAAAAAAGETPLAVQRNAGAPEFARASERVLAVDDEIELLAVTASWLKMLGYDVTPCTSAASALAALSDAAARGQSYALMVTDVIRPGMDGFALAHAARAQQPDLALLYVSGFADAAARGRDRPLGTTLEKPFRQAELATLVRCALDTQQKPHAQSPAKKRGSSA